MVARMHSTGKRPTLLDAAKFDDIPPPDDRSFSPIYGEMAAPAASDEAPPPPAKKPPAAFYRTMTSAINGTNSSLPPFPRRLRVIESSIGKLEALQEHDGGVVEVVPIEFVAQEIMRYTQTGLVGNNAFQWDTRQCRNAAEFWLWNTPHEPMPPAVRWADEDGLSFSVLPWRRGMDGPTPVFDELMKRLSNADAVKAWIGSLFNPTSDRQQYIWMYGDGQDGKGALARFLKRVFGKSYRALEVPTKDSRRFWAMQMTGLRLGVFPDCDDYHFTRSGFFKLLTGDDPVPIEEKGGGFYTRDISAKFLFLSNERPRIASTRADMRRIIFSEIRGFDGVPDPEYETRLLLEGGHFLAQCEALYEKLCPSRGRIPTDTDELVTWISQVEEGFTTVAERCFIFGPTLTEAPADVWDVVKANFKTQHERGEFLKFLERAYDVRKLPEREKRSNQASTPGYRYFNCRLKNRREGGWPAG